MHLATPMASVANNQTTPPQAPSYGRQVSPPTDTAYGRQTSPPTTTGYGGRQTSPPTTTGYGGRQVSPPILSGFGPQISPAPATPYGHHGSSPSTSTSAPPSVYGQQVSPPTVNAYGQQVTPPPPQPPTNAYGQQIPVAHQRLAQNHVHGYQPYTTGMAAAAASMQPYMHAHQGAQAQQFHMGGANNGMAEMPGPYNGVPQGNWNYAHPNNMQSKCTNVYVAKARKNCVLCLLCRRQRRLCVLHPWGLK